MPKENVLTFITWTLLVLVRSFVPRSDAGLQLLTFMDFMAIITHSPLVVVCTITPILVEAQQHLVVRLVYCLLGVPSQFHTNSSHSKPSCFADPPSTNFVPHQLTGLTIPEPSKGECGVRV